MSKRYTSLDTAAFYRVAGVKTVMIYGKYPNNSFYVETKWWMDIWYSFGGFVPFKRYMNARKTLKYRCRRMAGLPERFSRSKTHGFTPFFDLLKGRK